MQAYAFLLGLGIIGGTLLTPLQSALGAVLALFLMLLIGRSRALPLCGIPYLAISLMGVLWGNVWLHQQLGHRLPSSLDKVDVVLELQVTGVSQAERWQRLDVDVLNLPDQAVLPSSNLSVALPELRRLRVNVYHTRQTQVPDVVFQPGDRIRAQIRLKAIRSLANGLPFDYEALMVRQGIDARGYVRQLIAHQPAEDHQHIGWRQRLLDDLQTRVSPSAWPWVAGLVFGVQGAFDADQWALTQQTGTLHLLVVSGLHMGMLAGLVTGLALLLQRCIAAVGLWPYRGHAMRLRMVAVLLVGGGYVYLAGAGIALQRAWVMLAVAVLVVLLIRKLSLLAALSYAFAVILLLNPLVYTSAGFGFSMVAVAGLLLFMQGRKLARWQLFWFPQWVVFVCLLPVMLWWGQAVSLVHLFCNLVGIPLVGLLLLPLSFMTAVWPGGWWEVALTHVGNGFWYLLEVVAALPVPSLHYQPWDVLLAWCVLLAMHWIGARPLTVTVAMVSTLVLLFAQPAPGLPRLVMADVGQGQAMMMSYRSDDGVARALVIDTGARFSARFDAGSAIVVPQIRRLGVTGVDDLVISHGDLDHAGGWFGLVDSGIAIERQWYGQLNQPQDLPVNRAQVLDCHQSDQWHSRGLNLSFRFLILPSRFHKNDNDASCVVQIRWYEQTILVPGDISRFAELALLYRYLYGLKSDVLVAAHHGSRSSSHQRFLDAVKPAQVWISAGFNNRFGHPHPDVSARFAKVGADVYLTAHDGAVVMTKGGQVETIRSGWQPPWRQ